MVYKRVCQSTNSALKVLDIFLWLFGMGLLNWMNPMEVWVNYSLILHGGWSMLRLPVWRCCTADYCTYVLFLLLHRSTNNKDWQYGHVLHICIVPNRGDKYRQIMLNIINIFLGGGFKYFYFHPCLGKILTNIFQRGWNHQPDIFVKQFFYGRSILNHNSAILINRGTQLWRCIDLHGEYFCRPRSTLVSSKTFKPPLLFENWMKGS